MADCDWAFTVDPCNANLRSIRYQRVRSVHDDQRRAAEFAEIKIDFCVLRGSALYVVIEKLNLAASCIRRTGSALKIRPKLARFHSYDTLNPGGVCLRRESGKGNTTFCA
jgi:hypothetical protein